MLCAFPILAAAERKIVGAAFEWNEPREIETEASPFGGVRKDRFEIHDVICQANVDSSVLIGLRRPSRPGLQPGQQRLGGVIRQCELKFKFGVAERFSAAIRVRGTGRLKRGGHGR